MTAARQHGPLPTLLIGLTVVSGLVDAFSYLTLGHVFVANMTGNVVFLGFALAGVGDISSITTLLALASFAAGAALGGRLAVKRAPHRGRLLAATAAVQAVVMALAATQAADVDRNPVRLAIVVLLSAAMGGQNAMARRLAVPDLTTTVLTMTVTGLLADVSPGSVRARRMLAVSALLIGALAGGLLLRWTSISAPLWLAGALLAVCAAAAYAAARQPASAIWR